MRKRLAAGLVMGALGLQAATAQEGWVRLNAAGIVAALADVTVRYDAHTLEVYRTDGTTRLITERVADGLWEVRDDRFCSSWPPSTVWTCYDVDRAGDMLRFTGDAGHASTGQRMPVPLDD